jgi:hypothetical protein
MSLMPPRYPEIHVRLHSSNPFALISAVRLALRRSRVHVGEIDRFTEEALSSEEPRHMRRVCADWAEVEVLN